MTEPSVDSVQTSSPAMMAAVEPVVPVLRPGSSGGSGVLSPRSGQEMAEAAGRDVAAFNVIMIRSDPLATDVDSAHEGRSIILEVGDHGISCRDPYGALLKVVPLEFIIAWKAREETMDIVTSKNLEDFFKMRLQTREGAAIEQALETFAHEHLANPPRRRSTRGSVFGSDGFFGSRRGPSVVDVTKASSASDVETREM